MHRSATMSANPLADALPVRGAITSPGIIVLIDETFQQYRCITVTLLPVIELARTQADPFNDLTFADLAAMLKKKQHGKN